MAKRPNLRWAVTMFLVATLIFITTLIFFRPFVHSTSYTEYFANDCKYTLYFFSLADCPHCVSFQPTWNSLSKDGIKDVCFTQIDSTNNNFDEATKKYNVISYPSLILVNNTNKQFWKFNEQSRTITSITQWAYNHIK